MSGLLGGRRVRSLPLLVRNCAVTFLPFAAVFFADGFFAARPLVCGFFAVAFLVVVVFFAGAFAFGFAVVFFVTFFVVFAIFFNLFLHRVSDDVYRTPPTAALSP
jgi:hypothetical protein